MLYKKMGNHIYELTLAVGLVCVLLFTNIPKTKSSEFATNVYDAISSTIDDSVSTPALHLLLPSDMEKLETDYHDHQSMEAIISGDDDRWFDEMSATHRLICSEHETCRENDVLAVGYSGASSYCCGWCTCDSNCVQHGSCCLGVYDNFTHGRNSIQNTRYRCIHAQYLPKDKTDYDTDQFYWMISLCGHDESSDFHRESCENPVLGDDTLEKITPVTDLITGVNYKNIFCAYCSGTVHRHALIQWNFQIQSHRYIPFPSENFFDTLKKDRGNIIFIPPEYVQVESCKVPMYTVSSCNESGLWDVYEERFENACEAFIDPYNSTYKNYFCYLCNIAINETTSVNESCLEYHQAGLNVKTPNFFAILDISAASGEVDNDVMSCEQSQIVDKVTKRCLNVLCYKGKTLQRGKCGYKTDSFHPISTCYIIFFDIIPEGRKVLLGDINNKDFKNEVKTFILPTQVVGIYTNLVIFYKTSGNGHWVEKVIAFITVSVRNSVSVLKVNDLIESILDNHGAILNVVINPKKADVYINFRIQSATYRYSLHARSIVLHVTDRFSKSVDIVASREVEPYRCTGRNDVTVVINKLYTCAFLELNVRDLSYRVENDILHLTGYGGKGVQDNQTEVLISMWAFETDGERIRICLDDFLKLYMPLTKTRTSQFKSTNPGPKNFDPKKVLSLVCVCMSIICLLVTIATYFSLPVLRSNPGMNNLILSIFLLLAQSVYQFGAGQTSVPPVFCAIIGAVCHFLWLCVVFSLNLCSTQMFIIFKKQIKVTPHFDKAQTIRGIIYILSMSTLFVVINLVVSLVRSKAGDSGYGSRHICYINSSLMQAVTFVIPSAVTLIINIILFSYVVYKIRQIGEASVRINKERNYLGVYTRLSTLTGVTWIFGYLRILVEVEVLEYLFIVFNASQGVFILIAFILNRRVVALMCRKGLPSSIATTHSENVVAES